MRDARHAGIAVAIMVTTLSKVITPASVKGSVGDNPTALFIVKPTPIPPQSKRMIARRRASARHDQQRRRRSRRAMRVPNSAVRCATACDT
jgi:hypothetical protein